MNFLHLILLFVSCITFLINSYNCGTPPPPAPAACPGSLGGYLCCDELSLSSNGCTTKAKDCTCSDQTGGVGTCSCVTSPNTRQGWLCTSYSPTTDSVNIYEINKVVLPLKKNSS